MCERRRHGAYLGKGGSGEVVREDVKVARVGRRVVREDEEESPRFEAMPLLRQRISVNEDKRKKKYPAREPPLSSLSTFCRFASSNAGPCAELSSNSKSATARLPCRYV